MASKKNQPTSADLPEIIDAVILDVTPESDAGATPSEAADTAIPDTAIPNTAIHDSAAHQATAADGATMDHTAAEETTAAATAGALVPVVTEAKGRAAPEIIRNHVLLSMASGVIPLAFVDSAALAAVQLRMLSQLSDAYGVNFRAEIGKSAIATLFATVAPTALAGRVLGALALRMIPVVGTVAQLAMQPAFNGAFTYALGKVFEQHFASGGTFLTFDPEKVKAHFRKLFHDARAGKGINPEPAAA